MINIFIWALIIVFYIAPVLMMMYYLCKETECYSKSLYINIFNNIKDEGLSLRIVVQSIGLLIMILFIIFTPIVNILFLLDEGVFDNIYLIKPRKTED